MDLKITGIELFLPNGEARRIDGDEIEMMHYNEERDTISVYLKDGTSIDTNLPFMVHLFDRERKEQNSQEEK